METTTVLDVENHMHGHYSDSMRYTTENLDSFELRGSHQPPPEAIGRKFARWNAREQRIFIGAAELAMAKGHQSGKCFTNKGWERIRVLFNTEAGNKWTVSQLKNHWNMMRKEHTLLFELLNCTGVEFDLNVGNRIHASDQWRANKIQENQKYAKFKDRDCGEIYNTYSRLFGECYNSSTFAITPTKISRRGFGIGPDSNEESPYDNRPKTVESSNSSDGPTREKGNCSMDILKKRSGDKRKGKQAKEKTKKKRYGAREVTASLDQLASMGNNLESISQASVKNTITVEECIDELLDTGLIEVGREIHLFALWNLDKAENRNSFRAAKTPDMKAKLITYCFMRDQKQMGSRR